MRGFQISFSKVSFPSFSKERTIELSCFEINSPHKIESFPVFNGLDMFIYLGQKSFYLWNKINPEIDQELINLLLKNLK